MIDVVICVIYIVICGFDFWFYCGYEEYEEGFGVGYELMGIVEEVGEDVMSV